MLTNAEKTNHDFNAHQSTSPVADVSKKSSMAYITRNELMAIGKPICT
jgi:hypothetical protein